MRSIYSLLLLTVILAGGAFSQTKGSIAAFPGVTAKQLAELQTIKRSIPVVLPSWLPTGFKLEKINSKLGRRVKVYEREMALIYSRTTDDGKLQRFALEAGFDGLGDLMYEPTKTLKSPFGNIFLLYEPFDADENKKLEKYVMTEWFQVGSLAYHYVGMYGYDDGDDDMEMISLADTERILKNLKRL